MRDHVNALVQFRRMPWLTAVEEPAWSTVLPSKDVRVTGGHRN